MKQERVCGICESCCWFDGADRCLKAPEFNLAGDGKVYGMKECSGYIEIEEVDDRL